MRGKRIFVVVLERRDICFFVSLGRGRALWFSKRRLRFPPVFYTIFFLDGGGAPLLLFWNLETKLLQSHL